MSRSNQIYYDDLPTLRRILLKITPRSTGSGTGMSCRRVCVFLIQPHCFRSNELNASYAADGYARVNEGKIGVLTTTYVPQSNTLFVPIRHTD